MTDVLEWHIPFKVTFEQWDESRRLMRALIDLHRRGRIRLENKLLPERKEILVKVYPVEGVPLELPPGLTAPE